MRYILLILFSLNLFAFDYALDENNRFIMASYYQYNADKDTFDKKGPSCFEWKGDVETDADSTVHYKYTPLYTSSRIQWDDTHYTKVTKLPMNFCENSECVPPPGYINLPLNQDQCTLTYVNSHLSDLHLNGYATDVLYCKGCKAKIETCEDGGPPKCVDGICSCDRTCEDVNWTTQNGKCLNPKNCDTIRQSCIDRCGGIENIQEYSCSQNGNEDPQYTCLCVNEHFSSSESNSSSSISSSESNSSSSSSSEFNSSSSSLSSSSSSYQSSGSSSSGSGDGYHKWIDNMPNMSSIASNIVSEIKNAKNDINTILGGKIDNLEHTNSSLMAAIKSEIGDLITALNQDSGNLKTSINQVGNAVGSVGGKIDSANGKLSSIDGKLDKLGKLDSIDDKLGDIADSLKADGNLDTSFLGDLDTMMDGLKDQYKTFKDNLKSDLENIVQQFKDTKALFNGDTPQVSFSDSSSTDCFTFSFHGRTISLDPCSFLSRVAPIISSVLFIFLNFFLLFFAIRYFIKD